MSETIHTQLVRDSHAYTRSEEPWLLDRYTAARGRTSSGKVFGWKLFHYISGGGMRTFGRTIRQEELSSRQNRFLIFAAAVFVAWSLLLLF